MMEGRSRKSKRLTWIILGVIFLVLVIMLLTIGRDILDVLAGLDPVYVLFALACYIGVQLAWAIKWFLLVKRRVRNAWFPYVALANMYGNFVNITTPSGRMAGEPLRSRTVAKKYRAKFSTVFAASMVDKMTLTLAMIVLLIPLTIYMTYSFDMPRILEYLLGAFVLFWIGVATVSYLIFKGMGEGRSRRVGGFIYRLAKIILRGRYRDRGLFIEKVKNGILEFKRSFKILSKDPYLLTIDLFLGIVVYLFRFSAAYMFFLATGHSEPFLTVSTVVMIAFIVGLMSQLPGMIGVGESTMTGLYLAMGVNVSVAITVSILTQLNVYFFEIGVGYLSMVGLNVWKSKRSPF